MPETPSKIANVQYGEDRNNSFQDRRGGGSACKAPWIVSCLKYPGSDRVKATIGFSDVQELV